MNGTLDDILEEWPDEPKESAERLIAEYGEPDEFSASMLTWIDTPDGWKRTELTSFVTEHLFPAKHNDYLEQFINYRVPPEKFSQLAEFDGSVVVDRTRGEISARCGGTSMNFVAINLANDIITGERSVAEARDEYAKLYDAYRKGERPEYTTAFQFELPAEETSDPDVSVLKATA